MPPFESSWTRHWTLSRAEGPTSPPESPGGAGPKRPRHGREARHAHGLRDPELNWQWELLAINEWSLPPVVEAAAVSVHLCWAVVYTRDRLDDWSEFRVHPQPVDVECFSGGIDLGRGLFKVDFFCCVGLFEFRKKGEWVFYAYCWS